MKGLHMEDLGSYIEFPLEKARNYLKIYQKATL